MVSILKKAKEVLNATPAALVAGVDALPRVNAAYPLFAVVMLSGAFKSKELSAITAVSFFATAMHSQYKSSQNFKNDALNDRHQIYSAFFSTTFVVAAFSAVPAINTFLAAGIKEWTGVEVDQKYLNAVVRAAMLSWSVMASIDVQTEFSAPNKDGYKRPHSSVSDAVKLGLQFGAGFLTKNLIVAALGSGKGDLPDLMVQVGASMVGYFTSGIIRGKYGFDMRDKSNQVAAGGRTLTGAYNSIAYIALDVASSFLSRQVPAISGVTSSISFCALGASAIEAGDTCLGNYVARKSQEAKTVSKAA